MLTFSEDLCGRFPRTRPKVPDFLELKWLFPATIWFLALPSNIFESSQDCGWRWHKVGSWWHGRGGRGTHHKKRGHSHKDMWCDRTSCLSLSLWGNGGKEWMKGRDFKIILTFNRTQVRSLSTVVTNLDDPAYLNYPDHLDHLPDHLDHLLDHRGLLPTQQVGRDQLLFSQKPTARAYGPLHWRAFSLWLREPQCPKQVSQNPYRSKDL